MQTLTPHRRHANLALAAVLSAAAAFAAILNRFPPERYGFYPTCPFHALTGWLCPGCGATRALAALTHGHLLQALRLNALVVVFLPLLAAYCFAAYRSAITARPAVWPRIPQPLIAAALVIAVLFAIARNLA